MRSPIRQVVHRQHALRLRRGAQQRRQVLRAGTAKADLEEQLLKSRRCSRR